MPSQPSLQACSMSMSPSPSKNSFKTIPGCGPRTRFASLRLRSSMGERRAYPHRPVRADRKQSVPHRHRGASGVAGRAPTAAASGNRAVKSSLTSNVTAATHRLSDVRRTVGSRSESSAACGHATAPPSAAISSRRPMVIVMRLISHEAAPRNDSTPRAWGLHANTSLRCRETGFCGAETRAPKRPLKSNR